MTFHRNRDTILAKGWKNTNYRGNKMGAEFLKDARKITSIVNVYAGAFTISHLGDFSKPRPYDGLIFIVCGSAKYTFSNMQFTVHSGNVLYLGKGARYVIDRLTEEYRYICIDFCMEDEKDGNSAVFSVDDAKNYEKLFRKADVCWLEGAKNREIHCISYLYQLYSSLLTHKNGAYSPSSLAAKIKPAHDYILSHYAEPDLCVQDLSAICKLSEEQFRRNFKKCYNLSPMHYVTQIRIERAKSLLVRKECNQQTVAQLCGFSDVYYFGKAFKRICGISPGKYAALKTI